jgi:hypothetical protein
MDAMPPVAESTSRCQQANAIKMNSGNALGGSTWVAHQSVPAWLHALPRRASQRPAARLRSGVNMAPTHFRAKTRLVEAPKTG